MDEEESDQFPDQFAEIVSASLADMDTRPLRLKVLDWALVIAMLIGLGLAVGILCGVFMWVWVIVFQKF